MSETPFPDRLGARCAEEHPTITQRYQGKDYSITCKAPLNHPGDKHWVQHEGNWVSWPISLK